MRFFFAAYQDLHRLAHARLRDGGHHTVLDTTCLVHESYLRFVNAGELRAQDRRAFLAYASKVMRSVIVNSAQERLHCLVSASTRDRVQVSNVSGSCNVPLINNYSSGGPAGGKPLKPLPLSGIYALKLW